MDKNTEATGEEIQAAALLIAAAAKVRQISSGCCQSDCCKLKHWPEFGAVCSTLVRSRTEKSCQMHMVASERNSNKREMQTKSEDHEAKSLVSFEIASASAEQKNFFEKGRLRVDQANVGISVLKLDPPEVMKAPGSGNFQSLEAKRQISFVRGADSVTVAAGRVIRPPLPWPNAYANCRSASTA